MIQNSNKIKLTQVLAKKLSRLTIAIGFLISLTTPITYYSIESRSLKKTANLYAEDIADDFRQLSDNNDLLWEFQQPKFEGIISYFAPKKKLISIEILNKQNQNIPGYDYYNQNFQNWRKDYNTIGESTIIFNNRILGTVRVTKSQDELILTTLWLFLFSSATGISLSFLVYHFPLTISSQQEQKIQKLFNEIEYTAFHDPLTGLFNRAAFFNYLEQAIQLSQQQEGYFFAVLFLDLDRFKLINDSLGHQIGDRLLIAMTERITQSVRSNDKVARLGGDEFVVLLEQIPDTNHPATIAQRIISQLQKPFAIEGHNLVVTTSIGIATSHTGYNLAADILRDADNALYRAKELGKNRYELFDEQMQLKALSRLELENDLRVAIELNQIQVFYQPILDLQQRQIKGFEALARWIHPQKGLISPVEFISIAEEIGHIVPLSNYILRSACSQCYQWQQQYQLDFTLSVNISPRQFAQSNFVETVSQILQQTGFPPENLLLEITESTIIKDLKQAQSIIEKLRDQKIRIALDDFGTGWSSLSYLYQLPLNKLKIDRSFVDNIETDPDKLAVLRAISRLGNDLGINLIAEGIETQQQLAIIEELNIIYGQGYLFSSPLNSERAEALIASKEQLVEQFFFKN